MKSYQLLFLGVSLFSNLMAETRVESAADLDKASTDRYAASPGSIPVTVYQILNLKQPNPEISKFFFDAYKLQGPDKNCGPINTTHTIASSKNATLAFFAPGSELSFMDSNAPMLKPQEVVAESLIREKINPVFKNILKEKAAQYQFVNYEISTLQSKSTDGKETLSPVLPIYYSGRYLRKLDGRLILGNDFHVKVTVGGNEMLRSLYFRDHILEAKEKTLVPTKEKVSDSLKKWENSKTHSRPIIYPYNSDSLVIKSIKPKQVFESYIVEEQKGRQVLVPAVTVLAEIKLSRSKYKIPDGLPESPLLLHFHFPCRPSAGLCWPDGNQPIK